MSETPTQVVWQLKMFNPLVRRKRSNNFITIKTTSMPQTINELRSRIEGVAEEAFVRYELQKFPLIMNYEQAVNRFKKIPLAMFEVSYGRLECEIKAIAWDTSDEIMRELHKDWIYGPEMEKLEPRPRIEVARPDIETGFERMDWSAPDYNFEAAKEPENLETQYPSTFMDQGYGYALTAIEGHPVGETDISTAKNVMVGQRTHNVRRVIQQ